MSEFNNYNKKLKPFATKHRNQSTKMEMKIWCELLRDSQMLGYPFLRQRAIDKYIADFFCKDLKLIIEVDGISHTWEETQAKDLQKNHDLETLGLTILRFTDNEVKKDINGVKEKIEGWIRERDKRIPRY